MDRVEWTSLPPGDNPHNLLIGSSRKIKWAVSIRPLPVALEATLSMSDKGVSQLDNQAIKQHGIALLEQVQAESRKKTELPDRIAKMGRQGG